MTTHTARSRFRELRACRNGTTIIEFAVVAPMLFLLIMGIIELSVYLFTYSVLEGATNIGSRIGKTGYTSGSEAREDYIKDQVYQLSGGFLDPAQLKVEILTYKTFSDVGQAEPCSTGECDSQSTSGQFTDVNGNNQWDADQGDAGPNGKGNAGTAGSVVLYRVSYPWLFFTPWMRRILSNSRNGVMITAVATVRNEAF